MPSASAELVIPVKGYFPDQRFMPTEMSAFYDGTDKVYYFFHKDRLAFVSVSVESNPNQALKSKYPLVSSTQFQTGDRLDGRYDVELFKRGTTNTRIYNIYYAQDDSPLRSRFLIYIPSTILYQLQAEVTATVAAAREQERKANQDLQQATTRRVQ